MFDDIGRKLAGCVILYGLTALLLLVVILATGRVGIDFYELSKDPFAGQVRTIPLYTSILSNFGIVGWCFSAAIQFFAAWTVNLRRPNSDVARFLFWTGWITLFLMLDDFLMLHERMDRAAEVIIFGGYGLLVAVVLVRFRALIFRSNYLILAVALLCFLLSMVLDNVVERTSFELPYRTLLEDVFKIIGIVGWVCYFVRFSITAVRDALLPD